MALSRKRQRELNRLKRDAERLWDEQREAIEHASAVLKDARRQASNYAREEIRPRIDEGFGAARQAATGARERLVGDVLPAISGTIGSALAVLEAAKNPAVRDVVRRVSTAGQKAGVVTMPKKSAGPGRYILLGRGGRRIRRVADAPRRRRPVDRGPGRPGQRRHRRRRRPLRRAPHAERALGVPDRAGIPTVRGIVKSSLLLTIDRPGDHRA